MFVEVAKDIYQNQGYEKLKTFYLDATSFKHELNVSLLPYYYSLQLEDTESQNNLLSEILIKVLNFQQSFNLDIRNPHLRRKVTEYFQTSKKNIKKIRKTSKQKIVKYLGKKSSVTLEDIPKDYRNSKKITDFFSNLKYLDPKKHDEAITRCKNDLLLSLREGDDIGAFSLFESFEKIYGSKEFLENVFGPTINQIEQSNYKLEDNLGQQIVSYNTAQSLIDKINQKNDQDTKKKKVLICLPYGEQHSLGSKVIESYLLSKGNAVWNLPAFTSTHSILEEIRENNPDCVFISVSLEENISSAQRLVENIRENYKKPIFVGGKAARTKILSMDADVVEDLSLEKISKLTKTTKIPGIWMK